MKNKKFLAGLMALLCCFQFGACLTGFAEDSEPSTECTDGMSATFSAGDVTMDGNTDILDVITLNKALLGKELLSDVQNALADVNRDDKVDSSDSLVILKQIVGIQNEPITLNSGTVNLSEAVKSAEVTGKELDNTFVQSQTGFYLNLFQNHPP